MKFLFKYNTRTILDIVHIVLFWLLIDEYLVHKILFYFVHDPFITVHRDILVNRGYRLKKLCLKQSSITVWLVRAVKSDYFMLAMAVIKTDRSETPSLKPKSISI